MKGNLERKGLSLKRGLLIIMALCWILPITGIVIYTGYTLSHNVQGRIEDTITTSVDTAFMQTADNLRSAMDASRALSYDETVEDAYDEYEQSQDQILLYDTITKYLLQKYGYDDRFKATFLFFTSSPDDLYYTTKRTNTKEYRGLANYRRNVHSVIVESYEGIGTSISFLEVGGELYMVRNIVDKSFKPYAVLVMECDEETMFEDLRSIVWLKSASIMIDDITISVTDETAAETAENDGVWHDKKSGYYTIQTSQELEGHKLTVNVVSDSSDLVNELPNLLKALPYIIAFAALLLGFVLWAYYHFISHPMDMLIQAAARMEGGERGYTIEQIPHSKEFRYLTKRFNSMSKRLKYQFERIYEEQIELQDARVMALRSQINPHFLNNTLESVLWAARIAKDEKVCRMIEALSIMLNAAMARGGSARGTMEQEIVYTDAYLYITSIRLRDRITINREISDDTLKVLVPCLILQPIVENAVDHGIALLDKGSLTLRSYLMDDRLVIEVENDGSISKKIKAKIERLLGSHEKQDYQSDESECIGVCNVNRRLKILYGQDSGLTIAEIAPGRVLSRIVIPNVELGT